MRLNLKCLETHGNWIIIVYVPEQVEGVGKHPFLCSGHTSLPLNPQVF